MRTLCPAPKAPIALSSVSRMMATDHSEVVRPGGGGAYMIASSASGSEVFWGGSLVGPVSVAFLLGSSRIGGQVEQKTFRLRIGSTSLLYATAVCGRGAR